MNRRHFVPVHARRRRRAMRCPPRGSSRSTRRPARPRAASPRSSSTATRPSSSRPRSRNCKASLRGPLLLAGDAGYDQARRVLNESIDKHPALVVQPTGVADVPQCRDISRASASCCVAVKCGGHSPGGKSTCDGGMQIDLSRFRGVRVDAAARRAWVDGGSLLGDIDHETMALGLVTTAGTVSHTGVGGLTLGGGFGRARAALRPRARQRARRRHRHGRRPATGMRAPTRTRTSTGACAAAAATSASSRTSSSGCTRCSARSSRGAVVFPIERARELLAFYGEYSTAAPDELYVDAIMSAPARAASRACSSWHLSGRARRPTRSACSRRSASSARRSPTRSRPGTTSPLQRSTTDSDPRNEGTYLKSGFIGGFNAELSGAIVDGFQADPQRDTVLFFQHSRRRDRPASRPMRPRSRTAARRTTCSRS